MERRHKEKLQPEDYDKIKQQIAKDYLEGVVHTEIVHKLQNGDYGKDYPSKKGAENIVNTTLKALRKNFVQETEGLFEMQYYRLLDLYNNCLKDKDRLTAFQCIKELNRLLGFTQNVQNSQLSVLIGKMNGETDKEITISFSADGEEMLTKSKIVEQPKIIDTDCEVIK